MAFNGYDRLMDSAHASNAPKSYACRFCGQTFVTRDERRYHIETVHGFHEIVAQIDEDEAFWEVSNEDFF